MLIVLAFASGSGEYGNQPLIVGRYLAFKHEFGLLIQVSNANSLTCFDQYLFGTAFRLEWDYYFVSGSKTRDFEWNGAEERDYVSCNNLFLFCSYICILV